MSDAGQKPEPTEPVAAPAAPETPTAPTPEPAPSATPPAEAKPEPLPTDEPTLLETAGKEEKPETKAEPKPGEEKAETPTSAPSFEFKPYEMPEGLAADEAQVRSFNDLLSNQEMDHQARGQALLNLHADYMKQYAEHLIQEQHRVFADVRRQWREQIKADLEMGGSAYNTTIQAGARMRDLFVEKDYRGEFEQFLRTTGAGDHPAFWRLLRNAARRFDEPSPPPPGNRKPPADIGKKPPGLGGSRREAMYDHPSSTAKRN